MNIIKWLITAIFSFGLILCIGCKKQGTEWKGTIEIEDGTTIVKNPKLPIHNTRVLELTEDLVIKGSGEITDLADYAFLVWKDVQKINILSYDSVEEEEKDYQMSPV